MNRRFRPATAVFILSFMCFACGGGDGGGRGPTEPSGPTGKRFQFTVGVAPGNFEGGIQEGAVFFDGREVGRTDWSRAGGACTVACAIAADVQGVSSGDHTVRFTVVRQERTTTLYDIILGGSITDPTTGRRDPIGPVSQRLRMRAGESVSFTVRF